MAHQFRAAIGQNRAISSTSSAVRKAAGDLKAGKVIGGAAAVSREHAMKPAAQQAQRSLVMRFMPARRRAACSAENRTGGAPSGCRTLRRAAPPRPAPAAPGACACACRDGSGGCRPPAILPHLRRQLVVRPDVAAGTAPPPVAARWPEARCRVSSDCPPTSTRWQPISSDGVSRAPAHRVVKGVAVGHQRGRGENAAAVRLHDAFVHVRREAEIVGIDHQLPLSPSKEFQSGCVRNSSDWRACP